VLADVSLEGRDLATTVVAERLGALAGGDPEDGGEAADLVAAGEVVGSGIDLGNTDGRASLVVLLCELLPLGKKSLAVAAPGSIGNEEGISLGVEDLLLEGLADNDEHITLLVLRNLLALDGLSNLARKELGGELGHLLLVKLLEVAGIELLAVDDGERVLVSAAEAQVVEAALRAGHGNKVELADKLLRNRAETVQDIAETRRIVLSIEGAEDGKERKGAIADLSVVVVEASKRERDREHPLAELLVGVLVAGVHDLSILLGEVAVGNNNVLALLGGRSDAKGEVLAVLTSKLEEVLAELALSISVGNKDNVTLALGKGLDSSSVGKSLGAGTSTGTHVADNAVSVTRTLVLNLVAVMEDVESGIAVDAETLSKLLLGSGIDLSKNNLVLVLDQDIRGLDELGSKVLAVSAPRGKELDEASLLLGDEIVEGLVSKLDNVVSTGNKSDKRHKKKSNKLHFKKKQRNKERKKLEHNEGTTEPNY